MKRLASYSQYFLRRPALIKELLGHTTIKAGDTVYDLGAGSGVISSVLAQKVAQVVAVEFEPRMVSKLRENMAPFDNVQVIEGDVLQIPLPDRPYKVFANIPFHLSAEIVRRLANAEQPPQAIYLIVQKQFAHKLEIDTGHFTGQLGAQIAPWWRVRIRKPLKRTDYWPHPNVDTVLVELLSREDPLVPVTDRARYQAMIAECYHSPEAFAKYPKAKAGIPADMRPSEVGLGLWVRLSKLT